MVAVWCSGNALVLTNALPLHQTATIYLHLKSCNKHMNTTHAPHSTE